MAKSRAQAGAASYTSVSENSHICRQFFPMEPTGIEPVTSCLQIERES